MNSDFIVAVHALVYLRHTNALASSEELAGNICTNAARVRKILSKLKKSAIITSREGQEGGYRLPEDKKNITLSAIAGALFVSPVEVNWQSGQHDADCLISSGIASAMDKLLGDLNRLCLERLDQITIGDIENNFIPKKSGVKEGV